MSQVNMQGEGHTSWSIGCRHSLTAAASLQVVVAVVLAVEFSQFGATLPNNVSVGVLVVICESHAPCRNLAALKSWLFWEWQCFRPLTPKPT